MKYMDFSYYLLNYFCLHISQNVFDSMLTRMLSKIKRLRYPGEESLGNVAFLVSFLDIHRPCWAS